MNRILKSASGRFIPPLRFIWRHLPAPVLAARPVRSLGHFIYDHYVRDTKRNQTHQTRFMRNLPQLETLRELVSQMAQGTSLRIVSIGCSSGAELYSALWVIRSARPDLRIVAWGVDISADVVEVARRGVYRKQSPTSQGELENTGLEVVPATEVDALGEMLEPAPNGAFRVRDWLREGVDWFAADASDVRLVERLGPQDLVFACNFLGPMEDPLAEACLRNVARLVAPNGLFVVDGVDLDLKGRVVPSLGLTPITDRIEEAHAADPSKADWPWTRWSHEPFDRHRPDWAFRYATIFVKRAA